MRIRSLVARSCINCSFVVRSLVAVALFALVVPAHAGIEKYIDDKTAFAAEVDLTKIDPDAVAKWVTETFAAAQLMAPAGPGPTDDELKKGMAEMKKWLTDAKAQGATVAYVVSGDDQTPYQPFVVIVPVADDKAKAMGGLLYSGSVTGPLKPSEPATNDAAGARAARVAPRNRPIAEEVPGVGVMFGVPERINAVRATQPKARAEIDAGFKAAGAAPAKAVIAPTAKLRDFMRQAPAPVQTFVNNTQWLAASATVPPAPSARIIIQAKDAEAAKQLQQMAVMYAGMGVASGVGFTPEFTKLLTPTLQNDQVVLSFDDKQLVALATELKAPMNLSKQQAMRARSMSNIRQLLMACVMFKTENKNTWPANLDAAQKYLRGATDVMTNPSRPDVKPGYVYLKPTEPIVDSGKLVVIYESHTDFGNGIAVGFADGHAEYIVSKEQFDTLLAATAQAAQQ